MSDLHIWRTKMNPCNCHTQLCKSILELIYHISSEDLTFYTKFFIYVTWPRVRKEMYQKLQTKYYYDHDFTWSYIKR